MSEVKEKKKGGSVKQLRHLLLLSFLQSGGIIICIGQQFPAVIRAVPTTLPGDTPEVVFTWGSRGGSVFHVTVEWNEIFFKVLDTLFYHKGTYLQ